MANLDDDFDADSDAEEGKKKIDRKKILIFLLPALIAIGWSSVFTRFSAKKPVRKTFPTPLSKGPAARTATLPKTS